MRTVPDNHEPTLDFVKKFDGEVNAFVWGESRDDEKKILLRFRNLEARDIHRRIDDRSLAAVVFFDPSLHMLGVGDGAVRAIGGGLVPHADFFEEVSGCHAAERIELLFFDIFVRPIPRITHGRVKIAEVVRGFRGEDAVREGAGRGNDEVEF